MANQLNLADGTRSAVLNDPRDTGRMGRSQQYVHTTVTVKQPMNSHGGMRLAAVSGTQAFQVVDYATEEIQHSLARKDQGEMLEGQFVKLGSRGDAWRVVAVVSREH